jgi:hypothetical protein
MRSSRCRITFAVHSPRQNFRSLDFDQRKSILSPSQLPVWNDQPPRIFRQNSEMRPGRPPPAPQPPPPLRRRRTVPAAAERHPGSARRRLRARQGRAGAPAARGGAGRERRRRAAVDPLHPPARPCPPPCPPALPRSALSGCGPPCGARDFPGQQEAGESVGDGGAFKRVH